MELLFTHRFHREYLQALRCVKTENPDIWRVFVESVPVFRRVNCLALAALVSSIIYRKNATQSIRIFI